MADIPDFKPIDYKATVFLPATPFPMRGDLPKREPDLLARWDRIGLWDRTKAQMAGRPPWVLHDGPIYSNGNLHIGHALNRILKDVIMRAHRMAGQDVDYIPGWDTHGLPIEWKVEEEYRKTGRDKDAVPVLDFRDECRRYSAHWLKVQTEEFQRLGVVGDWAGALRHDGFLVGSGDCRGDQQVPAERRAVPRPAPGDVESGREDRARRGGDRVPRPRPATRCSCASPSLGKRVPWARRPLARRQPSPSGPPPPWTLPGNRAVAYGPEIDYALVHVGRRGGGVARPPRRAIAGGTRPAAAGLRRGRGSRRTMSQHVYKGAELAGLVCAHPLRGQGYDHDAPLLPAEYVTTDQGTGFVHTAPAHGEEDFLIGRAHGLEVPEAVGRGRDLCRLGAAVRRARTCSRRRRRSSAAHRGGGRPAWRAARCCHSYPHSWRSKAPVIYRATPQWFIRMDGPEAILRDQARWRRSPSIRLRAGGRAHAPRQHGRRAPGLVHQPPARLGRADPGVRGAPHRRAAARPGRRRPHHRKPSRRRAPTPGTVQPSSAIPGQRARSRRLRAGHGHRGRLVRERQHPCLRAWRPAACRGRRTCTWKAATSTAAGSRPACWKPSAPAGGRRTRRC